MKKQRYYQITAGIFAAVACVSTYVLVYQGECNHSLCRVYGAEESVVTEMELIREIEEETQIMPERYNDPEYLEDLEVVQEEVERREEIDMQSSAEAQISRERATQKALELREQKNITD